MRKKGFTLIEILSVILILSMLILIVVPNVVKFYNESKKRAFIVESQTIYTEALNQREIDKIDYNIKNRYCYDEDNPINELELSSKKELYYNVEFSGNKIVKISVSTPEYSINIEEENGVDKSDIIIEILKIKEETGYKVVNCIND